MNIANKITFTRIILIPTFMIFLMAPIPYGRYLGTVLFAVAAITDIIDGYIARRMGEISSLGKFLDPLADKLLVTAALLILVEQGVISSIPVIVILSREFLITGFRSIAAVRGKIITASPWGKIKTVVQDVAIVMLLWGDYFLGIWIGPMAILVFYLSVILTVVSGIDYIYKNKDLLV